jgi:hypothetical protein
MSFREKLCVNRQASGSNLQIACSESQTSAGRFIGPRHASLAFGILVSYALARWRFPGKTDIYKRMMTPCSTPLLIGQFL